MKKAILFIIIINACMLFRLQAQTYKLTYEPKGKIVEFYRDSIKFFTDYNDLKNYQKEVNRMGVLYYDISFINYLDSCFKNAKDTIIISNWRICFNCNDKMNESSNIALNILYVENLLINLININKLKIIDKHNKIVKKIYTKNRGSKKEVRIYKEYRNKTTNEFLFEEKIFYTTDGKNTF